MVDLDYFHLDYVEIVQKLQLFLCELWKHQSILLTLIISCCLQCLVCLITVIPFLFPIWRLPMNFPVGFLCVVPWLNAMFTLWFPFSYLLETPLGLMQVLKPQVFLFPGQYLVSTLPFPYSLPSLFPRRLP